ncbi:MAG: hypothetical protein WC637_22515 [Victivallales bacterium]|jgi:hypothetical protein
MKKLMIVIAAVMMTGMFAYAQADKPAADVKASKAVKAQEVCPVTNKPINKSVFVDAKGKRIYLCCKGCPAKVTAEPDKYIKQMEDQGIVLEKAPAPEAKK